MVVYYLSLDIESEGDDFDCAVVAIGAVFGPADGSWKRGDLIKFRGNLMPLPGQAPDPLCLKEFWEKNRDVYREIKASHRPAAEVMRDLLTFCQQLVARFEDAPGANGTIKLVTDCPDLYALFMNVKRCNQNRPHFSDLGRLHVLGRLQTQTWSSSIRHLGGLRRHGQVDPGERLNALGKQDECEQWIKTYYPGVVHDHRPENDAEHSYYQMVYLNSLKK
jgi:hypothetical protein